MLTDAIRNSAYRFNGSGKMCAVYKCTSSTRKIHIWRNTACELHVGMMQKDCPCLVPFSLHSFPKKEDMKREWIKVINRKDFTPTFNTKVCSIHFLDGSPSGENPVPQLHLGYPKKVQKGRRPLQRNNTLTPATCTTKANHASSVNDTNRLQNAVGIKNNGLCYKDVPHIALSGMNSTAEEILPVSETFLNREEPVLSVPSIVTISSNIDKDVHVAQETILHADYTNSESNVLAVIESQDETYAEGQLHSSSSVLGVIENQDETNVEGQLPTSSRSDLLVVIESQDETNVDRQLPSTCSSESDILAVIESQDETNVERQLPGSSETFPRSRISKKMSISCQTEIIIVKIHRSCQTEDVVMCDAETQWVTQIPSDHDYHKSNLSHSKSSSTRSTQADIPEISFSTLSSQDSLFFTGLRYLVLVKLLTLLMPHASKFSFRMDMGDQLLLVLMRLRLGLLFYDLGRRFKISTSLAVKICSMWLPMMAIQLKKLVFWLPRETIQGCLPECFKTSFPKTTCIIDCSEVFINRPLMLKARAQTYSSYKSHNTAKFLVGTAPNGFVMFISKCFGGRASDKLIVNESGFLSYILPGDEIMADRGFTIEEEVGVRGATVNMPSFTKGKKQLSEEEVTKTRRIASVRIHIERAIGRIKEFRILRHASAFTKVNRMPDDVVLVCAALTNLKPLLIKEDGDTASTL